MIRPIALAVTTLVASSTGGEAMAASSTSGGRYSGAAITVAVLIFACREILEWRRRRRERRGRLRAIRTVLARAAELNNWTLKALRVALEEVRDDFDADRTPAYDIGVQRDGGLVLKARYAPGDMTLRPLPLVYRGPFESHLLQVAELDLGLFSLLEPAITLLAELDHVRSTLVSHILREDPDEDSHFEGFIEFGLAIVGDAYESLDRLYEACAGGPLLHHRVR